MDERLANIFQSRIEYELLLANFQWKRSADPRVGLPIKGDGGQNAGPYP